MCFGASCSNRIKFCFLRVLNRHAYIWETCLHARRAEGHTSFLSAKVGRVRGRLLTGYFATGQAKGTSSCITRSVLSSKSLEHIACCTKQGMVSSKHLSISISDEVLHPHSHVFKGQQLHMQSSGCTIDLACTFSTWQQAATA